MHKKYIIFMISTIVYIIVLIASLTFDILMIQDEGYCDAECTGYKYDTCYDDAPLYAIQDIKSYPCVHVTIKYTLHNYSTISEYSIPAHGFKCNRWSIYCYKTYYGLLSMIIPLIATTVMSPVYIISYILILFFTCYICFNNREAYTPIH